MKIKIIAIYLLAFIVMFFTSCSEVVDTNAKELKSNVWIEKDKDNYGCKLEFVNDKGKFIITDKNNKKEYVFTGVTVVGEDNFTINDIGTLSKYKFNYKLDDSSVKITYGNKNITLDKSAE